MNDSKTMSKIFTANQPKTRRVHKYALALSVPPNADMSIGLSCF